MLTPKPLSYAAHMYCFCLGCVPSCSARCKISFQTGPHMSQIKAFQPTLVGPHWDTLPPEISFSGQASSTPCQQPRMGAIWASLVAGDTPTLLGTRVLYPAPGKIPPRTWKMQVPERPQVQSSPAS
jgi:hypothetical protein